MAPRTARTLNRVSCPALRAMASVHTGPNRVSVDTQRARAQVLHDWDSMQFVMIMTGEGAGASGSGLPAPVVQMGAMNQLRTACEVLLVASGMTAGEAVKELSVLYKPGLQQVPGWSLWAFRCSRRWPCTATARQQTQGKCCVGGWSCCGQCGCDAAYEALLFGSGMVQQMPAFSCQSCTAQACAGTLVQFVCCEV